MKQLIRLSIIVSAFVLTGCLATSPTGQRTPIDQVPMYGGMDRSQFPELKAADEKFISGVSREFGSREKATRVWLELAFKYYKQDRLEMAMRRFNQAWLLDPENPEVYAGFAVVLHDRGKNCDAMKMMEKALALNPPSFQGIYPDAGRIFTLCAVSDKTLAARAKADLLVLSEDLYKTAEAVEPNKRYVYASWATAYYWRGQYAEAWSMVAKERAAGGEPGEHFLKLLRAKMAEPPR
jgi:Tfp pilus assembly protein PilF